MELRLVVNLQRMAMLSLAQSIWAESNVKNDIKNIFLQMNRLGKIDEWNDLIKEILKSIPQSTLPGSLHAELVHVVKDIGCRIYDWHFFLKNTRLSSSKFTEENYDKFYGEIYWTNIGTIDEVKILKSWCNNTDIDAVRLFLMASLFCVEDVIDDLWTRAADDLEDENYLHDSDITDNMKYILLYWICHKRCSSDNSRKNRHLKNLYSNLNCLIDSSSCGGYHLAAKYFWHKLSNAKKQEIVVDLFRDSINEYRSTNYGRQYKRDRYMELCICFLNYMTSDMKRIVFEEDKKEENLDNRISVLLFNQFLSAAYPWQELLAPVFKQLQQFFDIQDVLTAFNSIINTMASYDTKFELPVDGSMLQNQLSLIWKELLPKFKLPVAEDIMFWLFDVWDVRNIKIILNDENLKEQRSKLVEMGYVMLLKLINEDEWEKIDQFVNDLLIFKIWDSDVKEKVKKIYGMIMYDYDVELAKEFLDAQCSSEEDKKAILAKINCEFLCYYLLKGQSVDVLCDFLNWVLPSKNDLDNFKKGLATKTFTTDLIHELWCNCPRSHVRKVNVLCSEFLEWLFNGGQEDIIAFKKDFLLGNLKKNNWEKLQERFFESDNFDLTSQFLSWCSCSSKEINEILQPSIMNYVPKECEEIIKKFRLQRAKRLLVWAFPSEKERIEFKKNFITSAKGLKAVIYFIAIVNNVNEFEEEHEEEEEEEKDLHHSHFHENNKDDEEVEDIDLKEIFKAFINFWITDLESSSAVEKHLIKFRKSKDESSDDDTNEFVPDYLVFDERETVALDYDFAYDSQTDLSIFWDEENFNLFLTLLKEARIEQRKKV